MFGKLDEIGGIGKPSRQKSGRVLTTNNTNNTNKKRGGKWQCEKIYLFSFLRKNLFFQFNNY